MQIKFIPLKDLEYVYEVPKPAKQFLPNWYKSMPRYISKDIKENGISPDNTSAPNTTLKSCSPFLDSLTSGYMFTLPCDIEVEQEDDIISVKWRINETVITTHDKIQFPTMPVALEGKADAVFKFTNIYQIRTPKGYSCLFVHPLNRWDLPFRTFSGVVETDGYTESVQFPFQFVESKKQKYIIEKGTPICQVIPFKRENWVSKLLNFDKRYADKANFALFSKIVKSYKSQWWVKKTYQ